MALRPLRRQLLAFYIFSSLSPVLLQGQAPGVAERWAPVGPAAATVFALESDPFSESTIYAGTYFGGLYRTVDRGQHWVHLPGPFSSYSVFSLLMDSRVRGRMFAGTFQAGIFVSDDSGQSWRSSNTGLRNLNIQQLVASPQNPSELLVATNSGVYHSADGGSSWAFPDGGDEVQFVRTVLFDPRKDSVAYAGTSGLGVYRSTDGGRQWSSFSNGLRNAVVVDLKASSRSGVVYAAVSNGVYRLLPGESVWVNITENLPVDVSAASLSIDGSSGGSTALYLCTDKGVYTRREGDREVGWTLWTPEPSRIVLFRSGYSLLSRFGGGLRASADGGRSWAPREDGMQNLFVGAIASIPGFGRSRLLAGSDSGVFQSESSEWKKAPNFTEGIFRFLTSSATPSLVYAGTERAGVWKSDDAGQTWKSSAEGIVPPGFFGLGFAVEPGVLYAATTSGLYVSRNGGEKWGQDQVTGTLGTAFCVAADPVERSRVLFGSDGGKVFESVDLGKTFTLINSGLPPELIRSIQIVPFGATYAVTSGGSVYALDPGNKSWYPLWIDPAKGALAIDADAKKPWILYLATQDGMYKSESAGIEWVKANEGIESPPQIYTVTVDQAAEGLLYAGGTSTIYRSTDSGNTWNAFREGLPSNSAVVSLAVDPVAPQTLLASLQDNGVFRSTDGGESWSRLSERLPVSGVSVLAIDPRRSGTIFVGTFLEGLYVSRNGREFVRDAPGLTLFVRGLAAEQSGQRLYAGALLGGIFRSDDGGASWRNRGLLDRNIFDVQADPRNPGTVYVGSGIGLARTTDGAETWSDIIPRVAYVTAMAVDPRNRKIVYTGSLAGRLNRSADGGETWKEAGRGLPYLTILSLAVNGEDGTVYASLDGGGIYRSTNGGLDWTKAADLLVGSNYSAQVIKVSPGSSVIYAASRGAGVFVSPDGGGFWASINGNLASYEVTDLAFDAENRLYVSTLNAGIFRTADIGKNWESISQGLPQQPAVVLASTPADNGRIYAATAGGVFWNSGGAAWEKLPNSLEGGIVTSVAVSQDGTSIAVVLEGVGILHSGDRGENWETIYGDLKGTGVRYLEFGISADEILAGTQGLGLMHTASRGQEWQGAIEPQLVEPAVLAVRIDPFESNTLYVGTAGAGLLISHNGGKDWRSANTGLESKQILSLVADPRRQGTLYAGTVEGGVYLTEDGGGQWRPLGEGLFAKTVTALTVDAADSSIIYAGTEGGGVFRLKRSGL